MDGLEVLARLHQTHPELPVLILSASSDRSLAEKALSKGAAGYLLKPFKPAQLEDKVCRALRRDGV
jgi:CheY-like chemotaxis protein